MDEKCIIVVRVVSIFDIFQKLLNYFINNYAESEFSFYTGSKAGGICPEIIADISMDHSEYDYFRDELSEISHELEYDHAPIALVIKDSNSDREKIVYI